MTPIEKAKTAALQVVVAARQTSRAITRDYIDVVMTRDKNTAWADANIRSVRMWVRKLAILSTDVIALTDREEYWMHRARFYTMSGEELDAIVDELGDNHDDPRGWDKNFVNALWNARSRRGAAHLSPRRITFLADIR